MFFKLLSSDFSSILNIFHYMEFVFYKYLFILGFLAIVAVMAFFADFIKAGFGGGGFFRGYFIQFNISGF